MPRHCFRAAGRQGGLGAESLAVQREGPLQVRDRTERADNAIAVTRHDREPRSDLSRGRACRRPLVTMRPEPTGTGRTFGLSDPAPATSRSMPLCSQGRARSLTSRTRVPCGDAEREVTPQSTSRPTPTPVSPAPTSVPSIQGESGGPQAGVGLLVQRLSPRAGLPSYQTPGSAGMDLAACLPAGETIRLDPGDIAVVPTGLTVAIPPHFEGQVRPRSGLATRHGVTVANAPGTIDSDYRGELKVAAHQPRPVGVCDRARDADCPACHRPGRRGCGH